MIQINFGDDLVYIWRFIYLFCRK